MLIWLMLPFGLTLSLFTEYVIEMIVIMYEKYNRQLVISFACMANAICADMKIGTWNE